MKKIDDWRDDPGEFSRRFNGWWFSFFKVNSLKKKKKTPSFILTLRLIVLVQSSSY